MIDSCLLYTSDAADDLLCVDLGGRRIIKKNGNIELDKQHSNKTFKHKSIFFKICLIHRLEYFCCQSTRSSWRYRSLVCYF